MRAGAECNIAAGQVDQLRHAKPCLQSEQKKHPISPARPGRQVGCSDESFDLRVGEIVDRPFLIPLGRHRQHFLAVMKELRFIDRDIREEGADRRQPCVAAARAIATPSLDEGQEVSNEVRIDIGDLERCRRPPEAIGGVFQQQAEGVPVARYRIRTGVELHREAFAEEPLQVDRERMGFHRASLSLRFRSARSQASCSSSGIASMYQ